VASITSSSALRFPVHLVKEILTMGRGAKTLEVKALSVAMAQVPPLPKGGSLDLIMTRTTLVGTLGGSLHPRHRNALLACIAEVSLIMGKLCHIPYREKRQCHIPWICSLYINTYRWFMFHTRLDGIPFLFFYIRLCNLTLRRGAGLVLNGYLMKKLEQPAALAPNLEDTRPLRTSSRRKSALLAESSGLPAHIDSDAPTESDSDDEDEAVGEKGMVFGREVVQTAIRSLLADASIQNNTSYRHTVLFQEMVPFTEAVKVRLGGGDPLGTDKRFNN
jgi:hypothetical protein